MFEHPVAEHLGWAADWDAPGRRAAELQSGAAGLERRAPVQLGPNLGSERGLLLSEIGAFFIEQRAALFLGPAAGEHRQGDKDKDRANARAAKNFRSGHGRVHSLESI